MDNSKSTTGKRTSRKLIFAMLVSSITAVGCAGISLASRGTPDSSGLIDGKLRPGPSSPNWVSSEVADNDRHFIPAFEFEGSPADAWQRLINTVEQSGGAILDQDDTYLHAIYVTRVMRFRDDFEARMAPEEGVIHVRSGSRVGKHDTGTNRRRVERLRGIFPQLPGPDSSANK